MKNEEMKDGKMAMKWNDEDENEMRAMKMIMI